MVPGGYSQGAIVIDLMTAVPLAVAGFTPAPEPVTSARQVTRTFAASRL